jgi:hypothetical protein
MNARTLVILLLVALFCLLAFMAIFPNGRLSFPALVKPQLEKPSTQSVLVDPAGGGVKDDPFRTRAWGISGEQVNVQWHTLKTSLPVSRYVVVRDGAVGGSPGNNPYLMSWSDTGLSPDTRYCYRVYGLDSAGTVINTSPDICAVTGPHTVFRKTPYILYPGDPTRMTVLFQAWSAPRVATLEWGPDLMYGDGLARFTGMNDHLLSVTITNLTPGTRTYYRVTVDGEIYNNSFVAAPTVASDNLTFYAYGDSRSHPEVHEVVVSRILADMKKDPGTRQTFIVHGGDFVEEGADEQYWDNEFFNRNFPAVRELVSSVPLLGVLGNHEYYIETGGDAPANSTVPFGKYFPYPGYPAQSPVESEYYYSVDYGPLHLTVLDSYPQNSSGYSLNYQPTTAQYQWLKKDLAGTDQPWKVVAIHTPVYHPYVEDPVAVQYLVPLFEKYNVSLVIQGHVHDYARVSREGTEYVTLGGGGAPLATSWTPEVQINPEKMETVYHFARLEIKDATLAGIVFDTEGNTIDSFVIRK